MSIGTPGQAVKVAIDTGSDELWVDPDCTSTSLSSDQVAECQADGQYIPSRSSTSNQQSGSNDIPYGKGEVLIDYYKDNIAVPDSGMIPLKMRLAVRTIR